MNRRELLSLLGGAVLWLLAPMHTQAETPMPTAVPLATPTPEVTPTPRPTLAPLPSPVSFDEASFMVLARSLTDLEREFYKATGQPFSSAQAQFKIYVDAIEAVRAGLDPWYPDFWSRVKARQAGIGAEMLLGDDTHDGKV